MKLRLIMNPGSRSGRGRHLWRTWEALLRSAGCDLDCHPTVTLDHARELASACNDADAVVAIGGDGTVNAVLDGVLQSGDSAPPMGVLYSGTSPDFCRFHNIPLEPSAAVHALLSRRRRVDAVRIACARGDGPPVTAHFGCSSNIGLGAAIARRANRWRGLLGDGFGTGLAAVAALLTQRPQALTVELDGVAHEFPRVNNLSILKNPFIASGLRLSLDLKPDDGFMHVVVIGGRSRAGLLRLLPGFYTGRAVHDPSVSLWRCRRIVVRGSAGAATEVEFDGDPHGHLPVTAELLPRQLVLLGAA